MTRNTKLYKVDVNNKVVIFRTLTCNELKFLDNITNPAVKFEQAAKLAIIEGYDSNIHFMTIHQIGEQALEISTSTMYDAELLHLTVDEFRMTIKDDSMMNMMVTIMDVMPTTTLEYLSNLTFNDLIELMCLVELKTNKKMFDKPKQEQPMPQQDTNADPSFFEDPDAGLSIADKIKQDLKYFKES